MTKKTLDVAATSYRRGRFCRAYRMGLDLVLGLSLLAAAGYGTYNVMKPVIPRVIEDIWVEPTSQVAGRSFNVHIKVFMNQSCAETSVQWSLIRVSDNEVVSQSVQPGQRALVGESIIVNERLIPASVPPGEYYYQSTVIDICGTDGSRQTFTSVAPKVYLRVL